MIVNATETNIDYWLGDKLEPGERQDDCESVVQVAHPSDRVCQQKIKRAHSENGENIRSVK